MDSENTDQVALMESEMREAGVPTTDTQQVDYFAFDQTETVRLPDGKSWVEFRILNEGQRRKYQNKVNRDVVIQRASGDAKVRSAPGDERLILLQTAIIDWNLVSGGREVPFSGKNLDMFLERAAPSIIDLIDTQIREKNPWLQANQTVEDVDKQITELQELRERLVQEREGKASS